MKFHHRPGHHQAYEELFKLDDGQAAMLSKSPFSLSGTRGQLGSGCEGEGPGGS